MTRDALRFDGAVFSTDGLLLGEARMWGSAERQEQGSPWRGWLRVTDLGRNELPDGHYRIRTAAGWEATFEPLVRSPYRVFEIDLLPVAGIGEAPWPDTTEEQVRYRPAWSDAPLRTADDRTHFSPALSPLDLVPGEGLLPAGLDSAPRSHG